MDIGRAGIRARQDKAMKLITLIADKPAEQEYHSTAIQVASRNRQKAVCFYEGIL